MVDSVMSEYFLSALSVVDFNEQAYQLALKMNELGQPRYDIVLFDVYDMKAICDGKDKRMGAVLEFARLLQSKIGSMDKYILILTIKAASELKLTYLQHTLEEAFIDCFAKTHRTANENDRLSRFDLFHQLVNFHKPTERENQLLTRFRLANPVLFKQIINNQLCELICMQDETSSQAKTAVSSTVSGANSNDECLELILKNVPYFDHYFKRPAQEAALLQGLKNVSLRQPTDGKGFCFVLCGPGGIGKSTLMAHVLTDRRNNDFLVRDCNFHIVIWFNVYRWRQGFNSTDRKSVDCFKEMLDLVDGLDTEREQKFRSLSEMINHFKFTKRQRILFIFDDVFDFTILAQLRTECPSILCCAITRHASVLNKPMLGLKAFLECSDVANPFEVGYLEDEEVEQLFTEVDGLTVILGKKQMKKLVKMCFGMPLIVNLIRGHFLQIKAEYYGTAFEKLTTEMSLGDFEVSGPVLGRDERQAKQIFEFSFESMTKKTDRDKYLAFILFDPVEEVQFTMLKDLWRFGDDDYSARELCDAFEKLSLVRHIVVTDQESEWRNKDCYLVHQILWEQALALASGLSMEEECAVNDSVINYYRLKVVSRLAGTSSKMNELHGFIDFLQICETKTVDSILAQVTDEDIKKYFGNQQISQKKGEYNKLLLCGAGKNHTYLVEQLLAIGANIEITDNEGNTPLIRSSSNSRCHVVKLLIEKGANIEATDKYGNTPLIKVSSDGHIDVVKLLIERRANIEATDKYGSTPLIKASSNGHIDIVSLLIEIGANIEASDKYGVTALIWASINGRVDVVKLLLDGGANIEATDKNGITALGWASIDGHVAVIKILIERGGNIEVKNSSGSTPLTLAFSKSHADVVKLLIESGAKIEATDKDGITALIWASINGHYDIVKLLVGRSVNIEATSNTGKTPLIMASSKGHVDIVNLLIENGANVKAEDKDGNTPLIEATSKGHVDAVKLLIERGVNIEATDKNGTTPLILASLKGHAEVVKLLIEKGAKIEATDKYGVTALIWASRYGHVDVVKLLLDGGANIVATNNWVDTPLILAASNGHVNVAKLLIDKGANVDATDKNGNRLLILTYSKGHAEVVKLLIEKGANIEATNNRGDTLLILASSKGHVDVVKMLIEKGANIEATNNGGDTLLILASSKGHVDVVKMLIEKGANMEATGSDGNTPLIKASSNGHVNVAKLLMDKGANVEATTKNGNTPLILASSKGHAEVVKLLIEKGANIEARDCSGTPPQISASSKVRFKWLLEIEANTPLNNASINALIGASIDGHVDVVKLLLDGGANIEATDKNGITALGWASIGGHVAVIKILIERGANIEATDRDGNTPLILASSKGHVDVVKMLMESGAKSLP